MPAATFESVIVARFLMELARRCAYREVDGALDQLASKPLSDQSVVEAIHNAIDKVGVNIATVVLSQTPWDALLGDAVFEGPDNCILIEFKASWDERETELIKSIRQTLVRSLNGENSGLRSCADRCHWFVFGPTADDLRDPVFSRQRVDPLLALTRCTRYRTIWAQDATTIITSPSKPIRARQFSAAFLTGNEQVGVPPDEFTKYLDVVLNGDTGDDGGFTMGSEAGRWKAHVSVSAARRYDPITHANATASPSATATDC